MTKHAHLSPPDPSRGADRPTPVSAPDAAPLDPRQGGTPRLESFCATVTLIERLHRLLLDAIKDEFERVGLIEINAVQGLLLYHIGDAEVTAGELTSRGYYQGRNVSYNLKQLVAGGFLHYQRCSIDRRAVRIRLTEQGRQMRALVGRLFDAQVADLALGVVDEIGLSDTNHTLRRLERFWSDRIRYIR
ncbi:MAG: MarR family winged helix-turn-helix transcriptional regulator [Paracoccaceae bacterium]